MTTEHGERTTYDSRETFYSVSQSLGGTQIVYGVPTTQPPQRSTLYHIIQSSRRELSNTLEEESISHSEGISTVGYISKKQIVIENKNRTDKDITDRTAVLTSQSAIYTTVNPKLDDIYSTENVVKTSNSDYDHANYAENLNKNELVTKTFSTKISNEATKRDEVKATTNRHRLDSESSESSDYALPETIGNLIKSGNQLDLEQKNGARTTRAAVRSLSNQLTPNSTEPSGNKGLESPRPTRAAIAPTTETYSLDENRLNLSVLMATNLEWCTKFAYDSLYQSDDVTIAEYASLSNNSAIAQDSIESLRLCQNTMVIKDTLRIVNITLYSYEDMLQRYIGGSRSRVVTFYNSLRKHIEKLINPQSKGTVLKLNSGSYVKDTSKTLETLATLNRLADQIENVLHYTSHCYRIWKERL